ncbi:MAG: LapA family protein [Candidatus Stygibacter australis]|nr:LapA family protein [Candidatus Stygibacter australis]MDP8320831.1 LapA family protein [Candidatus Stygibacter australis]
MQEISFNINLPSFAIGLAIGLLLTVYFVFRGNGNSRKLRKEITRQKQMLQDRLEVELESVAAMKNKIKDLGKTNSNLQKSLDALSQKASRAELQQLAIYQKAIDILTAQSPGFGPAWQNALENSKQEIGQFTSGVKPFIRNIAKSLLPEEID